MSRIRHTVDDEPYLVVRTVGGLGRSGGIIEAHAHGWGQLIHARSGLMTVETGHGAWIAPPDVAVWAPKQAQHSIHFSGECRFTALYLDPVFAAGAPGRCAAVAVSPLLQALIARAADLRMLDTRDAAQAAIALLIVDEVRRAVPPPDDLPQPRSESLRRIAARLLEADAPMKPATLAAEAGMGLRTLERRFLSETGMSLGRWRRRAALIGALRRLAGGESVKQCASLAGYSTPSAFVAAFHAAYGAPPARYLRREPD